MDDDVLLEALGAALQVDAEPSIGEVEALRALVAPRRRRVTPTVVPHRSARHALRAAAVVAAIVVGGGALVAALGGDVSPVLRPAERAIGIPVDSDELRDARSAMVALEIALARGDGSAIERAAGALVAAVLRLDDGDRAKVQQDATRLLEQADAERRRLAADLVAIGEPAAGATQVADVPTPAPTAGPSEGTDDGDNSAAAPPTEPPPATPSSPAAVAPPATPGSDDGAEPSEHEDEPDDHLETEPGDD
jgi:hypothetical protein